jgi:hypothetical protein
MPFSHTPKNPGDLLKSDDWNKALNAVVALFGKLDPATGHSHNGTVENGPQITEAGLANNAVSSVKIQDNAVTATKIPDGSIAGTKIVPNTFSRNVGIAVVSSITNGATIPPPAGFLATECLFFATAKFVQNNSNQANWSYNIAVDATGKVTITQSNVGVVVVGMSMAKKGGWNS